MSLTLLSRILKHSPTIENHTWACLKRCAAQSHTHQVHRHNHTDIKNRKILIKGSNVSPDFTKEYITKIFEDGELAALDKHDVTIIHHRMKHFKQCYIHGLHVGQFERAQKLVAEHDMKLQPVLNVPEVPENQKVVYLFAKADNLSPGCSEEDVVQLFKGRVHEDSHIYPLYNDNEPIPTSCYIAIPFETYTQAKTELEATNKVQLPLLCNTVHARSAIRDIEQMSKEHVILLRDLPPNTTISDLYAFFDPLEPTWVQRLEDYWFVTFVKEAEAISVFENEEWMKELGQDVQVKYRAKMRKFTPNEPFRFEFWKHNERHVARI